MRNAQEILDEAWILAQPKLLEIRNFLSSSSSSDSRAIRVGQLDSELLDQELTQLLQEPLNKALSLINTSLKAKFEPELSLLIQLTLYKLSVWNTGASYGAKLQDLRYAVSPTMDCPLAPCGLPRRTLFVHGGLTLLLPYLHNRSRIHALSRAWPDAPSSDHRRKAWSVMISMESLHALLGVINFVAFLWSGRYRSLADRILGMTLIPSTRRVKRDVSYEFMNRQMVWHAFTEFLLFLLPILNARSIRRRIYRLTSYLSPSATMSSLPLRLVSKFGGNEVRKSLRTISQKRGRYWSLPEDQCAICAENASFNLNLTEPANVFTSFSPAPLNPYMPSSETEPPAFPIYTPYITSCGHIYCYSCIAERMIRTADDADSESGWQCLRCGERIKSVDRHTIEVSASDTGDSDYEFNSDVDMDVTDSINDESALFE